MKFSNPDLAVHKPIPAPLETEYPVTAWGVEQCGESFKQLTIYRPQVDLHDVKFELKFCGICHSDVHNVLNEMSTKFGKMIVIFMALLDRFCGPTSCKPPTTHQDQRTQ